MISLKIQEEYVISKGWSTWYNKGYWVNPKTIVDPKSQDYTNYGMDLNSAYCFEKLKLPPFECLGLPIMSQIQQGLDNIVKIKELLKQLEESKE
jgi:hypothetical protein